MIFSLVSVFILGLLTGFYQRTIYDKLNTLLEERRDIREAKQVGVVRPIGKPITKNQPINLESETGGIRKMTPAELEEERQIQRAKVLQENHR